MLRDEKNDLFHLLNVLESIGKIEKYISNISDPDQFINANDQLFYNATLTLLANIGESISKLSVSTTSELNRIDLNAIRGMRNRIVHDYTGLNSFIVFEVAKNNLNEIQVVIEEIIKEKVMNGKFEKEEFEFSVENPFYKHVQFEKLKQ